ncbi:exo-beta-1,3-glucanase [Methylomonas sp. HW2-6]|uniref:exo-beta-1,3-glucanase n=1 Tax=Methylomonas sp. HW2-6 TaxID=3376687 RepID=UPI0040430915
MKRSLVLLLLQLFLADYAQAQASQPPPEQVQFGRETLQCAAFSPYVGSLTPEHGPPPSRQLIDGLLDQLIEQTPFRCIMTYGVINGLGEVFASAQTRHLKVIAIVWLDKDIAMNTHSIAAGIETAKSYPETIIAMSCGSEVRTRHGNRFDGEILRCIDSLRRAGVRQPLTTIDTWWEWCDRSLTCRPTLFADKVDWIGTNIFPWWENKFSPIHSCTTAEQAADFHIARVEDLRRTYPDKDVVITEFGWPNGPEGGSETNRHTGQRCGIANSENQALVVRSTFEKLAERGWSGVVFEAFSENWKPGSEGIFGSFWGLCQGLEPYSCLQPFADKEH